MLRGINSKPRGIAVFSALLIAGSIYNLYGFLNYDYYVFMFQQMPTGMINDRFIISVGSRIAGIFIAVGLFARKETARQTLIVLFSISLLTIHWRHPFYVFENISIYSEYQRGINTFPAGTILDKFAYPLYPPDMQGYKLVYPWHPKISRFFYMLIDFVFCSAFIYYFSRRRIRELFMSTHKKDK
ncbi:MAG: hypothetical protein AB7S78_08905 [Candidatus Omnitrophota bacterium]